jgi:pyridoxine 5-phosphate synthase
VPDAVGQLTSNHGWDTIGKAAFLRDIISVFKKKGIRVSIFVDPVEEIVTAAADTGTDRVELYTEYYAKHYSIDTEIAISDYVKAAIAADKIGLGLNAGHDLNLSNLRYFSSSTPTLLEVSIGHALISDALYYGLENTIQMYRRLLN